MSPTTQYWLCLDIGNTHTVAGLFPALYSDHHVSNPIARLRFRTDAHTTSDEYFSHLTQIFNNYLKNNLKTEFIWHQIERAIVSSVVPQLDCTIEKALQIVNPHIPCLFVNTNTKREFELDLPYPEQLGADRLANVQGALSLAKPPFLIIDAGTATTFCLIDKRPAYVGGAIAPGLEISWKALQMRASKLFSVELLRPSSSIGNTTETQLQSGVLMSHEAMLEGMTNLLLEDWKKLSPHSFKIPTFFATGGCMHLLKLSEKFHIEPDLTLRGLCRYGILTQ
ncbi:type III pantothenate kinase [Candidatus Nomurabacteria bacterium]|nr:type III pantothenate kinase [Candidatus Nomurabacteria bacterium]